MNALMAIPNLIALLLLSGEAARETKKYLWENRLNEFESD
jgi:AGCS family alanine or glycine:cation symporter